MKSLIAALALSSTMALCLAQAQTSAITDPAKAGQDYLDQGEYTNTWGGAQVIALGNGSFQLVTYKGGLPGAGWDKQSRQVIDGKRDADKIVFNGANNYQAELANGKLTVRTGSGGPWALQKIERKSTTLGAKPPSGAVVLFDGTTADGWNNGHMDERQLLKWGCTSKQVFTNCLLHVEFLLPFMPTERGQGRANSGVYVQDRYEIQVLDSFGLTGEDNECGGIYKVAKPRENMCLPPLTWQTYDVSFKAAQYDSTGKKIKNAMFAWVKHNGVIIHENLEIPAPTPAAGRTESNTGGPLQLQDHGNPVFYCNIWFVPESN